jgi:hypothetical protein
LVNLRAGRRGVGRVLACIGQRALFTAANVVRQPGDSVRRMFTESFATAEEALA